jgi:hypothetical protein
MKKGAIDLKRTVVTYYQAAEVAEPAERLPRHGLGRDSRTHAAEYHSRIVSGIGASLISFGGDVDELLNGGAGGLLSRVLNTNLPPEEAPEASWGGRKPHSDNDFTGLGITALRRP